MPLNPLSISNHCYSTKRGGFYWEAIPFRSFSGRGVSQLWDNQGFSVGLFWWDLGEVFEPENVGEA